MSTYKKELQDLLTHQQTETFGKSSHRTAMLIREATSAINYDCQFKDGKCKSNVSSYNPRCCCQGCAGALGYLRGGLNKIPLGSDKEILPLFSEKTGFWRKGKGCILPRKYRSVVCLSFNCIDNLNVNDGIRLLIRRSLESIYEGR